MIDDEKIKKLRTCRRIKHFGIEPCLENINETLPRKY